MNQLDITADPEVNTEGLDFVLEETRINILENKVTLCVSETSDAGIESFDDLASALKQRKILMTMGNSDVPVGQYTQKILDYYELNEEELADAGVISYGSNVKEVTTQISEGSVDCGVIYCTDAFSAGLTVKDSATAEMCGQVIYPAAVLKVSENQELAKEFLAFIQTDACMEIFEEVGFSRVQ
jgi:molybdate transport system substrate-binding protein